MTVIEPVCWYGKPCTFERPISVTKPGVPFDTVLLDPCTVCRSVAPLPQAVMVEGGRIVLIPSLDVFSMGL